MYFEPLVIVGAGGSDRVLVLDRKEDLESLQEELLDEMTNRIDMQGEV